MELRELIENLKAIEMVHPNASVMIGIPDVAPHGDQVVEIAEVNYDHLGKCVVIEL